MRKSTFFIWLTLIAFAIGFAYLMACDDDPSTGPDGVTPTPSPPTDIIDIEVLEACVEGMTIEDVIGLLVPIISGIPTELLDDDDTNDPEGNAWIVDMILFGQDADAWLCDTTEVDDLLTSLGNFIAGSGSKTDVVTAFNAIIDLAYSVDDWVDIADAFLAEITAEQIQCVAGWLSSNAQVLLNDAQNSGTTIKDAIADALGGSGGEVELPESLSMLEPLIGPIFTGLPDLAQELVNDLAISLLATTEPELIALMRAGTATEEEIQSAVAEVYNWLKASAVPAIVDLVDEVIDLIPSEYQSLLPTIGALLQPDSVKPLVAGLAEIDLSCVD